MSDRITTGTATRRPAISKRTAIEYFRTCSAAFTDFYSKSTPWWGRAPNFEHYQRMKSEMLSA